MGLLTDLGLLAFYASTFILYLFITAAQILTPSQDAHGSAIGFAMKLLIRVGLSVVFYFPVIGICGRILGYQLSQHSENRRQMILDRIFSNGSNSTSTSPSWPRFSKSPDATESLPTPSPSSPDASSTEYAPEHDHVQPEGWEGIVGFFHPFCNAGGGGERVLWAAIKATQEKHPRAVCVVYTGDHDASKAQIIARVKDRFNIELDSLKLFFLYLSTRRYVLASTWARFTLLGQSLGSVVLAFDAFQLLVPDVFIDTMGYGFALGFARLLFPQMPTGAYVHYPTISTDMLGSLDTEEGKGLHAGAGKGLRGFGKKLYWQLFAWVYGLVGGTVDVVMTNSSWTQSHIRSLWEPHRESKDRKKEIKVLFPPCAVEEIEEAVKVDEESEKRRENILLYIAQFRPEKDHKMILDAFAQLVQRRKSTSEAAIKLALIGSVRDSEDATRVYELRLLAHEQHIKDEVEFVCDASWPEILQWLQKSSVGVNGMWNEHFGIGVVEYQAAGLISVVNDSGGPKQDIVVDYEGGPTGYHASTAEEYADAFGKALAIPSKDKIAMRQRARESAKRFTEAEFVKGWNEQIELLLELLQSPSKSASWENPLLAGSYLAVLAFDTFKLIR